MSTTTVKLPSSHEIEREIYARRDELAELRKLYRACLAAERAKAARERAKAARERVKKPEEPATCR